MQQKSIHKRDALRLLEDRKPHTIRVWKLSTGDILQYKDCVCHSAERRRGTHKIKIPKSSVIREFRDITLFEIDNLSVYL